MRRAYQRIRAVGLPQSFCFVSKTDPEVLGEVIKEVVEEALLVLSARVSPNCFSFFFVRGGLRHPASFENHTGIKSALMKCRYAPGFLLDVLADGTPHLGSILAKLFDKILSDMI